MKAKAIALLSLLGAAGLDSPGVSRTVLVKQAFLYETVRPLYSQWIRTFRFIRYLYGPYDSEIFQLLDALIFNGLVEVISEKRRGGRTEAQYRITEAGLNFLRNPVYQKHREFGSDLVWALQTLGVDNASAICRLVYREAEFARIFATHELEGVSATAKVPLPVITSANNATFLALSLLIQLDKGEISKDVTKLHPREILRVFLKYLAQNSARKDVA